MIVILISNLNNYRNSYKFFVPYDKQLEKGIILNKNGGFQTTCRIRFYDLDFIPEEDYFPLIERINNAYKRLPDGYTLHIETQRKRKTLAKRKDLKGKNIPTQIIGNIRNKSIENSETFVSEYYLTISYILTDKTEAKMNNIFKGLFTNKKQIEKNKEEVLEEIEKELEDFKSVVFQCVEQLKTAALDIKILDGDDLATYLYSTINQEFLKVKMPPKEYLLDEYLTVSNIYNGDICKINDKYIKALTINVFPNETILRVFKELDNLKFEYRCMTRYIVLSREEALKIIKDFRIHHYGKRKNALQYLVEAISKKETNAVDTSSIEKANQSLLAENELKTGVLSYGYYTFTILVSDKNLKLLNEKIADITKIIQFNDFTVGVEKQNTLDSIFSAIPGNIVSNIRKMPINTYLLAALTPMSSIYNGDERNKHLNDEPLLVTRAGGSELFNLNLHVGDVGHSLIIGPTGSGKSVHLALIANQFLKYDHIDSNGNKQEAQVFIFDKDCSSKVLTLTSDGIFYDLGKNELTFQPLMDIDRESEKEFALEWISGLLEQEGIEVNYEKRLLIWEALTSLANTPKKSRTLQNFTRFLQDYELREALATYTFMGAYGKYFDNDKTNLVESNFQTFEMGDIINKPKVLEPVLNYIFHKIEVDRLDGRPTLLILDECWLFLKNKKMKDKIEEWLRVLRKKNTSVIFATQSLSEIASSTIFSAIIDACKTQIFLPNERAVSTWSELYKSFSLNDKEIETINNATAKKDYFVKSVNGSRLYQLNLSNVELAYLGASDKNSLNKITDLYSKSYSIKELNKAWLTYNYNIGKISNKEIKHINDMGIL